LTVFCFLTLVEVDSIPDALTEKQKVTKIGHLLAALKKTGAIDLGEKKAWIYIGDE
jgi:hypothetical protein